jgi:hypothetical protein
MILGANRLNETIELPLLADNSYKMGDLGDHAASLTSIRQLGDAADPVEVEPDQDLALPVMPPYGAPGLPDYNSRHARAPAVKAEIRWIPRSDATGWRKTDSTNFSTTAYQRIQ